MSQIEDECDLSNSSRIKQTDYGQMLIYIPMNVGMCCLAIVEIELGILVNESNAISMMPLELDFELVVVMHNVNQ